MKKTINICYMMKPVFDLQISFTVKKSKTSKLAQNYHSNSMRNSNIKKCLHLKDNSNSNFCEQCACIYINTKSPCSTKPITSIKSSMLNYQIEIPPIEELNVIKSNAMNQERICLKEINHFNSETMLEKRKKIISKIKACCRKYNFNQYTLQHSVFLMDLLTIKYTSLPINTYEKIAMTALILSIKFCELEYKFLSIKQVQSYFDNASIYSLNQIRQSEISSLLKLKYNLNQISFMTVANFLYTHGILFSFDKSNNNNISFIISQIVNTILYNSVSYLQYNQFYIGCGVIASARVICKLQKWPKIFETVYNIKESDFSKEFEFIYHSYTLKKLSIVNIGRNAKRNRSINRKNLLLSQPKKIMSQSLEMTRDTSGVGTHSKKSHQVSVDYSNTSIELYKKKKKINKGVGLYLKHSSLAIGEISARSISSNKKDKLKLCSLNNSIDKVIKTYRAKQDDTSNNELRSSIHNVKVFSSSFHNKTFSNIIATKCNLSARNYPGKVTKLTKDTNRYNRNDIKKSFLSKHSVDIIEELIKQKIRNSMKLSQDLEKSILKTSFQGLNTSNNVNKAKKISKLKTNHK